MGSHIIPSTATGLDFDDHSHASFRMGFLSDLQRFREKYAHRKYMLGLLLILILISKSGGGGVSPAGVIFLLEIFS